jgi:homoserine dehydrogenase
MKKITKVALIGFGTVGSGLYRVATKNGQLIHERTGVEVVIKTICDLNLNAVKDNVDSSVHLTTDWKEIISDNEIDTIVELIGGIEPAKTIIEAALKAGKNVVTANKKLLAEAGVEIFDLSNSSNVKLGFEAAIGGGIPCVQDLKSGLVANRVHSVIGILNGTTNYILTRMEHEALAFDSVLKDAQKEGFAEADPTFDIEGNDAAHKITLLAMLAFNKSVDYHSISIEGITKIEPIDVEFAREMGFAVKLLGIAREESGKLDVRVHPAFISEEHQLSSVSYEFNAVVYDSDMTGEVLLYGRGAGSLPTASAVMSDIVQIALKEGITESAIRTNGKAELITPSERCSRFYVRMYTEDHPGVLEKIAHCFASNSISISSVVQLESETGHVPLLLISHNVVEANIIRAIEEINTFDFVEGDVMMIRIEEHTNEACDE